LFYVQNKEILGKYDAQIPPTLISEVIEDNSELLVKQEKMARELEQKSKAIRRSYFDTLPRKRDHDDDDSDRNQGFGFGTNMFNQYIF